MPTIDLQHRYTEATHRVTATVDGAEPVNINTRQAIRPERVTATYRWRTQLGHTGWREVTVEIAGPFQPHDGDTRTLRGSASLISSHLNTLPAWAREFADTHRPHHIRLVTDDAHPGSHVGELGETDEVGEVGQAQ